MRGADATSAATAGVERAGASPRYPLRGTGTDVDAPAAALPRNASSRRPMGSHGVGRPRSGIRRGLLLGRGPKGLRAEIGTVSLLH